MHSTARHGTAQYSTAQCNTAHHSTAQCNTAHHSAAQHSTLSALGRADAVQRRPPFYVVVDARLPPLLLLSLKVGLHALALPACRHDGFID